MKNYIIKIVIIEYKCKIIEYVKIILMKNIKFCSVWYVILIYIYLLFYVLICLLKLFLICYFFLVFLSIW